MKRIARYSADLLMLTASTFPGVVLAANDVFGLTSTIYTLLKRVGQFLFALAVMLFIWGVVKFIANTGDTAEHEKGKSFILWALIAWVVLLSIWGIVNIVLSGTFGITPGGMPNYIRDTFFGVIMNFA